MELINSSFLSLKKHDKFMHMALIVLDMISSCNMSNATIVYNEFKCFIEPKSEGKGNAIKEDCWLRAGFIFGEIIRKVESGFRSLIILR
jgi:cytochrome c biogenesis factor